MTVGLLDPGKPYDYEWRPVSRMIITAIGTACIAFFLYHRRLRLPLIIAGVIAGTVTISARDVILDSLSKVANESEETTRVIMINGEEEEYNGTRRRSGRR